jgi:hypothetical protein
LQCDSPRCPKIWPPHNIGHVHAAEFGFSFVNAGTMLAAKVSHRDACFVLPQDAADLFFHQSTALHVLVRRLGQNERQTGLSPAGNVRACWTKDDNIHSVTFQVAVMN